MRSAELNTRAVGRIFNLLPQTVFLVVDEKSFNVDNMDTSRVWTCNGDSSKLPNHCLHSDLYLSHERQTGE